MILAGVCILVAALLLLWRDFDRAFVIAVLGLVAWFLNYRAQMKGIIAAADSQESSNTDAEESSEDSDDD
jgi:hypothetical protein